MGLNRVIGFRAQGLELRVRGSGVKGAFYGAS